MSDLAHHSLFIWDSFLVAIHKHRGEFFQPDSHGSFLRIGIPISIEEVAVVDHGYLPWSSHFVPPQCICALAGIIGHCHTEQHECRKGELEIYFQVGFAISSSGDSWRVFSALLQLCEIWEFHGFWICNHPRFISDRIQCTKLRVIQYSLRSV